MPYNRIRKAYTRKPSAGAKPNLGHPLAKGLEAWYPGIERGGGTLRDYSGNNRHIDLSAATAPSWGVNGVLDFNGSDEFCHWDDTFNISSVPWTLSCWWRPEDIADNQCIVSLCDSGRSTDDRIGFTQGWNGSGLSIGFQFSGQSLLQGTIITNSVGQWTHCVVVQRAIDEDLDVYYDGVFNSHNDIFDNDHSLSFDRISIGRWGDSSPNWYADGQIADVRVYNRELSAGEIKQIYEHPWVLFSRPLPIWIPSGAAPPAWNNTMNEIAAPGAVNEITNANIQSVNEI